MLRVVCEIDGGFVIQVERRRLAMTIAELVEQSAHLYCLLRGFGSCDDFGLAGGQRHRRLLFATPGDGGASSDEWPSLSPRIPQEECSPCERIADPRAVVREVIQYSFGGGEHFYSWPGHGTAEHAHG
eukprot:600667-Pleurochrysis_carterae.AAC.1